MSFVRNAAVVSAGAILGVGCSFGGGEGDKNSLTPTGVCAAAIEGDQRPAELEGYSLVDDTDVLYIPGKPGEGIVDLICRAKGRDGTPQPFDMILNESEEEGVFVLDPDDQAPYWALPTIEDGELVEDGYAFEGDLLVEATCPEGTLSLDIEGTELEDRTLDDLKYVKGARFICTVG